MKHLFIAFNFTINSLTFQIQKGTKNQVFSTDTLR